MRRSTKMASVAAMRSKAMATVKTPAQPIFGITSLAANGVQALGTTVMKMP